MIAQWDSSLSVLPVARVRFLTNKIERKIEVNLSYKKCFASFFLPLNRGRWVRASIISQKWH